MTPAVSPAMLLGTLLLIGYAALFHLWQGRSVRDLMVYLLAAGIGFTIGQLVGTITQAPFLEIGQLHTFEATLGAWLLMGLVFLMRRPGK